MRTFGCLTVHTESSFLLAGSLLLAVYCSGTFSAVLRPVGTGYEFISTDFAPLQILAAKDPGFKIRVNRQHRMTEVSAVDAVTDGLGTFLFFAIIQQQAEASVVVGTLLNQRLNALELLVIGAEQRTVCFSLNALIFWDH